MTHSYDVIKPLNKYITCNCAVFIPVSNGKNYKNPPRETRVIVENNVSSFFLDMVYVLHYVMWLRYVVLYSKNCRIFGTAVAFDNVTAVYKCLHSFIDMFFILKLTYATYYKRKREWYTNEEEIKCMQTMCWWSRVFYAWSWTNEWMKRKFI